MATAKRRLSPADFDVVRGAAHDVKALRKFVEQEGAAATVVVEEALDRGSSTMHKTAWQCLAQLDPTRAETKALVMTAGLTKKAKAALLPLWVVATTGCLDRLVALGIEVYPDKFPETSLSFSRAQGWALAVLLRSPEVATQKQLLQAWFGPYNDASTGFDLLRGALEHPAFLVRSEALQLLIGSRDVEACRLDSLPEDLVIRARFVLPAAEAFDRLRPWFESNPSQRGAVIRALGIQQECDPRWVELFSSLDDSAVRMAGLMATRRPEALALLTPLIQRMEPGPELLTALMALRGFRSAEAAALLVPWLSRSELDGNAALLSTSLRECGSPADAAALEAAAERNPQGALFYREAIAHIEARHPKG
ncbi:MAG: hypothetical protein Q8N23_10760 [Archangium sp.]|nr:hypothetical protein [Archangium sp.]MDP3572055.1 hypothetical protein [Archangium sp.]